MKNKLVKPINNIKGTIEVDPDKSITHRSFILASLADGKSIIHNPLNSSDCINTLKAFNKLGIISKKVKNTIHIWGKGLYGLKRPNTKLNLGNSGTGMRLLAGILSALPFNSTLTGDNSLKSRPMKRIIDPLKKMGGNIKARNNIYPPLIINKQSRTLKSINYKLPMASAQVKSCILLASLYSKGTTIIHEPIKSRNHSEIMLKYLDINITNNKSTIKINNNCASFKPKNLSVPGDISSAAFFIVLGLLKSKQGLLIKNVGLNPTRIGIIKVLKKMGGNITIRNSKIICGEKVGDIFVKKSCLRGVNITKKDIPSLIDEIPIIVVAASQAETKTKITGAVELRYKETDRIKTITSEFNKLGMNIEELEDGLIINGNSKLTGNIVKSHKDHRIAMSLIITGLIAKSKNTTIVDIECINTSFPGFFKILNKLVGK